VKRTLTCLAAVAVAVTGFASPGQASVQTVRAKTTVTIQTQNGDFWGYLKSPRPAKCAQSRKVTVFKQLGAQQNPKTDQRVASDTASKSGTRYMWSTGNTGLRHGRYYARVTSTPFCKRDTSETVRSSSTT
jgi:hypothetical protein